MGGVGGEGSGGEKGRRRSGEEGKRRGGEGRAEAEGVVDLIGIPGGDVGFDLGEGGVVGGGRRGNCQL